MITANFEFEEITFPNKEKLVRASISNHYLDVAVIEWEFEDLSEIVVMGLLCNIVKRSKLPLHLKIPYLPFSRQDRAANPGDAFSLIWFSDVVNRLKADKVVVCDPHSDVTTALLKNCEVIEQHEVFAPVVIANKTEDSVPVLICPDAGATKKILKLAKAISPAGIIFCIKDRNTASGGIKLMVLHGSICAGRDVFIVDDICDGGATFVEIAKQLMEFKPNSINLCVTHGFFTKGLQVFDGLIDHIYTRKGKIK